MKEEGCEKKHLAKNTRSNRRRSRTGRDISKTSSEVLSHPCLLSYLSLFFMLFFVSFSLSVWGVSFNLLSFVTREGLTHTHRSCWESTDEAEGWMQKKNKKNKKREKGRRECLYDPFKERRTTGRMDSALHHISRSLFVVVIHPGSDCCGGALAGFRSEREVSEEKKEKKKG